MKDDRPTAPTAHKRGQSVRTAYRRSPAPDCPSSVQGGEGSSGDSEIKTKGILLSNRLALRPAEVAEALGLSERTIRQLLPELPVVRIGTAVVVPTDLLKEWLRERAQQEKGAVDRAVEDVLDGLRSCRAERRIRRRAERYPAGHVLETYPLAARSIRTRRKCLRDSGLDGEQWRRHMEVRF